MILFLWELIVNAMELFLFYFYAKNILPFKQKWKDKQLIPLLLLCIEFFVVTALNQFEILSSITSLITLLFDLAFVFSFCKASWPLKLFYGALYSAICLVADYVTVTSGQFFLSVPLEELLFRASSIRIVLTSFYLVLIAAMVFLIIHIKTDKVNFLSYQRALFVLILVIGIAVIEFLLSITIQSSNYNLPELTNQLAAFNTIFILLFLLLLFYIFSLGRSRYQIKQWTEQNAILSLEEEQYRNLIETTTTLRELKHDLEHHLSMIQFFIDHHDYEKLASYIQDYQADVSKIYRFPTTGHPVLDCLIASILQKTSLYDIEFSYAVFLPSEFQMNEIRLNALLGNLFENALDACQKQKALQPETTAEIRFSIKPYQNMLAIHMENTCIGDYKFSPDGSLLSTKENHHFLHGIGLSRIRNIVEESHGLITIKPSENHFVVHILLPLQADSSDFT